MYQPHTLEHTHTLECNCDCVFVSTCGSSEPFRPQPNPFDKPKCNKNHKDATATGLPTAGTLHDDDDDDEHNGNEVQFIEKSIKSEYLLINMLATTTVNMDASPVRMMNIWDSGYQQLPFIPTITAWI